MGECGCGETNPHALLDAPGEDTYGIQVYGGCHYCHTPIAVDVYRFRGEMADDFFAWTPTLNIQTYGGDTTNGVGTLIVIDPDRVPDLIEKMIADNLIEDAMLTELRTNDWRRILGWLVEPHDPQSPDDAKGLSEEGH